MPTNQPRRDRLESNCLVVVAAVIFVALCAAGHFAATALAGALPLPGR
jgi:hypothetical protein